MTVRRNATPIRVLCATLCLVVTGTVQAQKVRVTEAVPASAEQGVIMLDVEISGGGFDPGSEAIFLVTGNESDTGGVHVRSSRFVNSKKLIANIDIEDGAVIGDYDIEVRTTSGRRGKGNTLFKVLEKGAVDNGTGSNFDCTLSDDVDPINGGLLSDGTGIYSHGVDKVECYTGGASQPNQSRIHLYTVASGPLKKARRHFDLALTGGCLPGNDCDSDPVVPAEFFARGSLENGHVLVAPYEEQGYLQHLQPGAAYQMAASIYVNGYAEQWVFRHSSRVNPGSRVCDMESNPYFSLEDAVSQDVTVYVWDDGSGYTVTTGSIVADGSPPVIAPGVRLATLCSDGGQVACPGTPDETMCNLRGQVAVQFTLHARSQ